MHILHICSDFLGTTAHTSLFKELDFLGVIQTVFVPLNSNADPNRRTIEFKTVGSSLVFSRKQHQYHKFLYGCKINRLTKDVETLVDINSIDMIHTSVMCNEGAVAFELHKKYGLPYITAIRNTDINSYMKVFRWRRGFFKKIANNAERIIFISSQYPMRLLHSLRLSEHDEITRKFVVIHNGLQDFYIQNILKERKILQDSIKVVVTGAFVKNKNIHSLYYAIEQLRNKGLNIELVAIGNNLSTYNSEKEYAEKINDLASNTQWFKTYKAQPKEELFITLRQYDIFALVSFQETFGLSYLEALSQGLPVVYTKNEGFDNTFPDGFVGYGAYATDVNSISVALENVINNYERMSLNVSHVNFDEFKWSNIARRYQSLYNEICGR